MKNKQNLTQNRDFLMICQMTNIHNNQFKYTMHIAQSS